MAWWWRCARVFVGEGVLEGSGLGEGLLGAARRGPVVEVVEGGRDVTSQISVIDLGVKIWNQQKLLLTKWCCLLFYV